MSIQMEMDFTMPKKLERCDPTKTYILYAPKHTKPEIIKDFVKDYGDEPEYMVRHGSGWTVGPVPEEEVKRRRGGR